MTAARRALARYRSAGADLPFADPRAGHGVAMEGHFWRFVDATAGRVVVALCGICRAPDGGGWANVALAAHPGGFLREATVAPAAADRRALRVTVGDGVLVADASRVQVDLGADASLDVRLRDVRGWPRRAYGGSGVAHAIPALGQYWHPHVLGGRVEGRATLDGTPVTLDGATAYAEKNWGPGGFPPRWWWGQAASFADADVCVAFAGGDVTFGPATLTATALVVRLGDTVVRLGNPLLSPLRAEVGDGRWRVRGRGPRWAVALEATGDLADAHLLSVPLPAERRRVPGPLEHLAGDLRLVVRERGRVAFAGRSRLAGLEAGGPALVDAELARRRAAAPDPTNPGTARASSAV